MFLEFWEGIVGFIVGVDMIGWRIDWRDKSGCEEIREEVVVVI